MEALHQLDELFQQEVTKNNDTPNSVAPPRISPTRQAPQARVPIITTPAHKAYPHCSNIIKDDDGNHPLNMNQGTQQPNVTLHPTRLRNISKGGAHPPPTHHAISKGGTTATVPNSKLHLSTKIHLIQVRRCGKIHRNCGSKLRHSPNQRSIPRIPPPHNGRQKKHLENILCQRASDDLHKVLATKLTAPTPLLQKHLRY